MPGSVSIASIAFLVALVCALVMGFAIQRGATCLVAAVDEILAKGRAHRMAALVEASVWVTGGVLLWRFFGGEATLPIGYPATLQTVAGGALLGFGAFVTRACVFGAVARFGSGEWLFVLTPLGFFLGCLSIMPLIGGRPQMRMVSLPAEAHWLLLPFLLFAGWRIVEAVRAALNDGLAAHIWSPHRATAVIGILFVISLLAIGPWAYTYALASLARGSVMGVSAKLVLLVALFLGALVGGSASGRLKLSAPSLAVALRCLLGGVLMGWGSMLIPGGNDELLLVGIPLLQPYAWLAVVSMAGAIAAGQLLERRLVRLAGPARLR